MIKRDYMKEIENSLKLVREEVEEGIIFKSPEKAILTINKELRGLVGLDIDTVNTLAFNSIKDMLSRENEYNAERYIALGELLRLNGTLLLRLDDESEGIYYYKKALLAYCQALEEDESITVRYTLNIEIILEELAKYQLTIDENNAAFRTYELLGKYDKAEDILFYMLKESNNNKDIKELGIDFYTRLENLLEDDLIKGNLPIEEVIEAIKHLKES
jgi:tetratricopeptide (TPR) repeat protein